MDVSNLNIFDLTGIEYFTWLQYLNCSFNKLSTLTLETMSLVELECANNFLVQLMVVPLSRPQIEKNA
jgi:Leucine-rich repeat (LRR) protein